MTGASDQMNDSDDGFSTIFPSSSEEFSLAMKLAQLRKACRELESQILTFSEASKFDQVTLQKMKNERATILSEIERIKDEMI